MVVHSLLTWVLFYFYFYFFFIFFILFFWSTRVILTRHEYKQADCHQTAESPMKQKNKTLIFLQSVQKNRASIFTIPLKTHMKRGFAPKIPLWPTLWKTSNFGTLFRQKIFSSAKLMVYIGRLRTFLHFLDLVWKMIIQIFLYTN